jgi:hypothetical protein
LKGRQFAGRPRLDQTTGELGFTGQIIALYAIQHIALEMNREPETLWCNALPLNAEGVIPSVCMKQTGHQGCAQDFAHLNARHATAEDLTLLFGDEVALDHLGHIGFECVSIDTG